MVVTICSSVMHRRCHKQRCCAAGIPDGRGTVQAVATLTSRTNIANVGDFVKMFSSQLEEQMVQPSTLPPLRPPPLSPPPPSRQPVCRPPIPQAGPAFLSPGTPFPMSCFWVLNEESKQGNGEGKALLPNFGGLVLGCIEADVCE